jgi:hypothetical protein
MLLRPLVFVGIGTGEANSIRPLLMTALLNRRRVGQHQQAAAVLHDRGEVAIGRLHRKLLVIWSGRLKPSQLAVLEKITFGFASQPDPAPPLPICRPPADERVPP